MKLQEIIEHLISTYKDIEERLSRLCVDEFEDNSDLIERYKLEMEAIKNACLRLDPNLNFDEALKNIPE